MGIENGEFNPAFGKLSENPSEYQGDISPRPESKDQRVEIAAGLLRIIDSVEQGN